MLSRLARPAAAALRRGLATTAQVRPAAGLLAGPLRWRERRRARTPSGPGSSPGPPPL